MSDLPNDITVEDAYKFIETFMKERDAKVLADIQWLNSNSKNDSSSTEFSIKERDEKIARLNQVLYAIAWVDENEFRYSDIEKFVRLVFPESYPGGTLLNVTNAMSEMANQNTGILIRNLNGDAYMLKYPALRGCLRNILRRAENGEKVEVGK